MRTGIRIQSMAVVVVASLFFLMGSPFEVSAKTLKIGHILSPKSNQNQALVQVFKPYVEKASGDALKIEVFPNEQLGHGPDQVEGVKMGTQAMFLGDKTWWEAYVPEIGVASVPFLFENREHFHRWVDDVLAKAVMDELIEKCNQRLISLDYKWYRGPFKVICSKKPVFKPEDMRGLRLRLWPARMIQKSWAGFGAEIHTIDFAEAYLALKQGVVEAITTPLDLVWPQKFTEVTKFVTELKQIPMIEIVSINEELWQSLSNEHRKIIKDGLNKAGKWYNDTTMSKMNEIIDDRIVSEHGASYIKVDRKPFVDHCRENILPELISDNLIEKDWIEKVDKLR